MMLLLAASKASASRLRTCWSTRFYRASFETGGLDEALEDVGHRRPLDRAAGHVIHELARERPGIHLADIMEPDIEMIAPLADEFLRHAAKIEILFEDETAPTFLTSQPDGDRQGAPMPEPMRMAS